MPKRHQFVRFYYCYIMAITLYTNAKKKPENVFNCLKNKTLLCICGFELSLVL